MTKNFLKALIVMLSLNIYCQNIKFQPNINHKARTLKQGLNKSGDSLILESSKKPILQVDIFNEDFLESIKIDDKRAKINLSILPAGDFVVQARVGRKRIIMYLKKLKSKIITYSEQERNDIQNDNLSPELQPLANSKKKKNINYYWVIEESNSNFGSTKTMRLIYKNEVDDLIEKNKMEIQSEIGKDNTLVIYSIYNKNKFMRKQFRNPKYYQTVKKSKFFNVVPYYSSLNEIKTIDNSL